MSKTTTSPRALQNVALYLNNALNEIELADTMGIDLSELPPDRKRVNRQRLRHAKRQLDLVLKDVKG